MKLPSIFSPDQKRGFTLIEILLVIALVGLLSGFTIVAGTDFYRGYAFRSEVDLAVAALQKARSQALSNLNQTAHGVHLAGDGYTVFEGPTFNPAAPTNALVPIQWAAAPADPVDISFEQLSATTASATVVLTDGHSRTVRITVNREGRISW